MRTSRLLVFPSFILTRPSLCWWWKEKMWTASTRPWPRSPTSILASSPHQASDGCISPLQYSECTFTLTVRFYLSYLRDETHAMAFKHPAFMHLFITEELSFGAALLEVLWVNILLRGALTLRDWYSLCKHAHILWKSRGTRFIHGGGILRMFCAQTFTGDIKQPVIT